MSDIAPAQQISVDVQERYKKVPLYNTDSAIDHNAVRSRTHDMDKKFLIALERLKLHPKVSSTMSSTEADSPKGSSNIKGSQYESDIQDQISGKINRTLGQWPQLKLLGSGKIVYPKVA